jgi:hypothetical protein
LLLRPSTEPRRSADGVLLGTKPAPSALGKQPAAHFPLPRARPVIQGAVEEWLRPRLSRRQPFGHFLWPNGTISPCSQLLRAQQPLSEITNTPKGSRRVRRQRKSPGRGRSGALQAWRKLAHSDLGYFITGARAPPGRCQDVVPDITQTIFEEGEHLVYGRRRCTPG